MTFRNHFSTIAREYAVFRPTYPAELFAWLAGQAPDRRLAWDGATGSGQAARGLAVHFEAVIATDGSIAQLAAGDFSARAYRAAARSEEAPIAGGSVALATSAQSLHWLDIPRYFAEVRRVLTAGGIAAVWAYSLARIAPGLDELVDRFYHETVGPWWPPERKIIEDGYRSIEFPFTDLAPPPFDMSAVMTLESFGGYLGTWSAVTRYRSALGHDPVPPLLEAMRDGWGPGARMIRWPLILRVGRR